MIIKKCIIPAAGFGTRFLPATKAQPKEMLTIVDTPVVQLLVEEAIEAGVEEIFFITNHTKKSLEDHFDSNFELETLLASKGKTAELDTVTKISKLAKFTFIRQGSPRGDGDAILKAKHLIGDEPCLVLFGDDLIRGKKGGAAQLVEAYEHSKTPVIALERVSDEKVSSYGIVETSTNFGKIYKVSRFLEKPQATETNSRLGVIGKYIITKEVFDYLEKDGEMASKDGEIRLADAFAKMLADGKELSALEIEGVRYDTGDKLGYLKATVDYALENPKLKDEFLKFLQEKVTK